MKFKMPKVSFAPKLTLGEGLPRGGPQGGPGGVRPHIHTNRLHLAGRSAFGPGSATGAAFATPDQTPGPDAAFGGADGPGAAGAAGGDSGE